MTAFYGNFSMQRDPGRDQPDSGRRGKQRRRAASKRARRARRANR